MKNRSNSTVAKQTNIVIAQTPKRVLWRLSHHALMDTKHSNPLFNYLETHYQGNSTMNLILAKSLHSHPRLRRACHSHLGDAFCMQKYNISHECCPCHEKWDSNFSKYWNDSHDWSSSHIRHPVQRAEQQEQQGTDWSAKLKFLCKSPLLPLAGQPPTISQQRLKKFGALQLQFQPCWHFTLAFPHLPGVKELRETQKPWRLFQGFGYNEKHILANEIQLGTLTDGCALTAEMPDRPDRSQISPTVGPPLNVFGTVPL